MARCGPYLARRLCELLESGSRSSEYRAAIRIFRSVHLCVPGSQPIPTKIVSLRSRCVTVSKGILVRTGRTGHESTTAANQDQSVRRVEAPREVGTAPESVLRLQRLAGNAAVARVLAGEQRPVSSDQGATASEQDVSAPVQRSAVHDVLAAPGRPLNAEQRREFEGPLGADLSSVRVHSGDPASSSAAAAVDAEAFTSGNHVVFGGPVDRRTLAHELTHVVQQRQGPVAGTDNGDGLRVSDPGDRFEREAEATADALVSQASPVQRVAGGGPPEETGSAGGVAVQRAASSVDTARGSVEEADITEAAAETEAARRTRISAWRNNVAPRDPLGRTCRTGARSSVSDSAGGSSVSLPSERRSRAGRRRKRRPSRRSLPRPGWHRSRGALRSTPCAGRSRRPMPRRKRICWRASRCGATTSSRVTRSVGRRRRSRISAGDSAGGGSFSLPSRRRPRVVRGRRSRPLPGRRRSRGAPRSRPCGGRSTRPISPRQRRGPPRSRTMPRDRRGSRPGATGSSRVTRSAERRRRSRSSVGDSAGVGTFSRPVGRRPRAVRTQTWPRVTPRAPRARHRPSRVRHPALRARCRTKRRRRAERRTGPAAPAYPGVCASDAESFRSSEPEGEGSAGGVAPEPASPEIREVPRSRPGSMATKEATEPKAAVKDQEVPGPGGPGAGR